MRYWLQTIRLWFIVSRPLLYPLVPLIALFGYRHAGGTLLTITTADLLLLLCLTLPFSLVVYGLNDIYDYASDIQNMHRHLLTGGAALPDTHRRIWFGVLLSMCVVLLAAVYQGSTLAFLMCGVALGAAFLYSVPPLRLKSVPFADMLFSGAAYVLVPFLIGTAMRGQLFVLPEVVVMALFLAAYHLFCSVRDIEADRKAGDQTTAVFLGYKKSIVLTGSMSLLALLWWYSLRPMLDAPLLLFGTMVVVCFVAYVRGPRFVKYAIVVVVLSAAVAALYELFR